MRNVLAAFSRDIVSALFISTLFKKFLVPSTCTAYPAQIEIQMPYIFYLLQGYAYKLDARKTRISSEDAAL